MKTGSFVTDWQLYRSTILGECMICIERRQDTQGQEWLNYLTAEWLIFAQIFKKMPAKLSQSRRVYAWLRIDRRSVIMQLSGGEFAQAFVHITKTMFVQVSPRPI